MEELLACVYLIEEGLQSETLYENKLNELFAATPYCNDLFKLELLSGNIKESIVYIKTHIDYSAMNKQIFGKTLMTLLKPIYASMDEYSAQVEHPRPLKLNTCVAENEQSRRRSCTLT